MARARAHIARAVEEVEAVRRGFAARRSKPPAAPAPRAPTVDVPREEAPQKAARLSYSCIDCKVQSPEAESEYTLISSRFGWRLSRKMENGTLRLEWRCPTCWSRHRQGRASGQQLENDEMPPSSRARPIGGEPESVREPLKRSR